MCGLFVVSPKSDAANEEGPVGREDSHKGRAHVPTDAPKQPDPPSTSASSPSADQTPTESFNASGTPAAPRPQAGASRPVDGQGAARGSARPAAGGYPQVRGSAPGPGAGAPAGSGGSSTAQADEPTERNLPAVDSRASGAQHD